MKTCRPLLRNRSHVSASRPNATIQCQSVRSCFAPLRSVKRSVVASEKFATFCPDGSARISGLAPRLPITITLLIAIAVTSIAFVEPASRHRAGRAALCFHHRATFFRAALTPQNWRAVRRFLDARAERAAGRARDTVLLVNRFVVFPKVTWRVVLAQRTPPLRAAAKRRRGRGRRVTG